MATLARLQRQIADEIPLARAAGVRLALDDRGDIRATAPFDANRNLHATAFGGSLYVVALVCGFAQTSRLLEQAGIAADVVVHTARATYRRPLTTDLEARIESLAEPARTRFVDTVARRGRGRLALDIVIDGDDGVAFTLAATFVARGRSADNEPNAHA